MNAEQEPLVSVVVPVYNEEGTILECWSDFVALLSERR